MTQMTAMTETNDALIRFLLETSGVRGVLVRLTDTWAAVRARTDYPAPVATCLGETLAATALMTGHAKVDGRLSVQLRGTGALRSLFAECTRDGTLRGLARYSEPLPDPLTPRAFGEQSLLAITIETIALGAHEGTRYQGLVGLDADTLSEAFEGYFAQSEQLPTRMLLAANQHASVGLMLQKLPGQTGDTDGWQRASAVFETLGRDELLATPPTDLLFRLFHEDGVRLLDTRPLRFGCSCSRKRVAAMLHGLGREEALAAVAHGHGSVHPAVGSALPPVGSALPPVAEVAAEEQHQAQTAEVVCEFCGQAYRLAREEVMALFEQVPTAPAPGTLH